MTDQKPTTKIRKNVTIPRLFNAVEDIVKEAGLDVKTATIQELYQAFEDAIVEAARGL